MILDRLIPPVEFNTTELTEIAIAFSNPSVVKYLKEQQRVALAGIVNGDTKEGESAESYLRREAVVKGVLGALEQLLAIPSANADILSSKTGA